MPIFIDRRLNPKDKSLGNRQRFLWRAREDLKHSIRNSLHALLQGSLTPSRLALRHEDRMEDVRDLMLARLGELAHDRPHLARRIRMATDVQGLWYLRGDLMSALAAAYGETRARHDVAEITKAFHGLLPRGMAFKVDPLEAPARGYVCENLGASFRLPELGPIGSNGLANARDFEAPVAWHETDAGPYEIVKRHGAAAAGKLAAWLKA